MNRCAEFSLQKVCCALWYTLFSEVRECSVLWEKTQMRGSSLPPLEEAPRFPWLLTSRWCITIMTDFLFQTVTYPAYRLALFTFAQLSLSLFCLLSTTPHPLASSTRPGGVGERDPRLTRTLLYHTNTHHILFYRFHTRQSSPGFWRVLRLSDEFPRQTQQKSSKACTYTDDRHSYCEGPLCL